MQTIVLNIFNVDDSQDRECPRVFSDSEKAEAYLTKRGFTKRQAGWICIRKRESFWATLHECTVDASCFFA